MSRRGAPPCPREASPASAPVKRGHARVAKLASCAAVLVPPPDSEETKRDGDVRPYRRRRRFGRLHGGTSTGKGRQARAAARGRPEGRQPVHPDSGDVHPRARHAAHGHVRKRAAGRRGGTQDLRAAGPHARRRQFGQRDAVCARHARRLRRMGRARLHGLALERRAAGVQARRVAPAAVRAVPRHRRAAEGRRHALPASADASRS